MKKTLVALAALAATASFAQSSVTISGAVSTALSSAQTTLGSGASTSALGFFQNGTGTTNVTFSGVEDLGGGMKALFLYEIDPAANLKDSAPPSGEVYVGLSGGFGTLRLGTPNQPSLGTQAGRNPFGTKTGGGFGGVQGSAKVRMNASMRYDTPSFSGFSASLGYGPEVPTSATAVGQLGALSASAAAGIAAGTVAVPTGVNSTFNTLAAGAAMVDIALNYANGPLAAGVSFVSQDAAAATSTTIIGGSAGQRQTNYFVSYAFGDAKVFFGGHNQDNLAAAGTSTQQSGNNLGGSYTMGSLAFMANYALQRMPANAAGASQDQRIWGLGVDYNFSKRTGVYARMNQENRDNAAAAGASEIRNTMVGLIHRF